MPPKVRAQVQALERGEVDHYIASLSSSARRRLLGLAACAMPGSVREMKPVCPRRYRV